jgi:ketosteroid isomerase-like protein
VPLVVRPARRSPPMRYPAKKRGDGSPSMRGFVRKICSLFLICVGLSVLAAGQDKSRIMALENSWNQAELHNDAHAVDLLLAEDFVMTVADGYTMNKAQTLASVRDASYRPDALQSDDMTVHMYGNTAVVTGAFLEKGKDKGKPFERRGRFTDTWINLNGEWRCAASHFSVKPAPAHD